METLLSGQDCQTDCLRKGCAPRMFAWQGDEFTYCSPISRTCSSLFEQMHAISGCYMPVDGSHKITEECFFLATSVVESGTSRHNGINYPATPTWHYRIASSEMKYRLRDAYLGIQGCKSRSALHGWTFTKARNYEIMDHAFCRTTPMARVSSLELLSTMPTHSLQPCNARKHSLLNGMKEDGKEPLPSMNVALLDKIKAGQEREISSSSSSKRGVYKDHCNGLMPFDAVVTRAVSTPRALKEGLQSACSLSIKKYSSQEVSHSMPMKERWAGPAFSNSPPPSSLPLPTFTRRQLRNSSLEVPQAEAELLAASICASAPRTPSRSFSLPSVGTCSSHLDTNDATQSLRKLLNLDIYAHE